ncbi:hypothetical protein F750_2694 [Streptomyces sp. PAMC 26508]|nr:hypothetical protein F750_2694 [Streptomyces sp. PAMC 26508]
MGYCSRLAKRGVPGVVRLPALVPGASARGGEHGRPPE